LGIEIVTFEEWIGEAEGVLKEVGEALGMLMSGNVGEKIFGDGEGKKDSIEEFEGVM
jgi:hypothetical protein